MTSPRKSVVTGVSARASEVEDAPARLTHALAELIDEKGLRATNVVDIVRVAQASKRTFYQYFSSKEDCYLSLLEVITDGLIADIRAAVDRDAPWRDQIRQAVQAYADNLIARPAISLSWIRDLPSFGDVARPTQRRNFSELGALIADLVASPPFSEIHPVSLGPDTAVFILGGMRELAAQTVEDGRTVDQFVGPAAEAISAILSAAKG
jgi:AcrR family transcriptional regulator